LKNTSIVVKNVKNVKKVLVSEYFSYVEDSYAVSRVHTAFENGLNDFHQFSKRTAKLVDRSNV